MAARAGVRIDAGVRRNGHRGFRQHPGRDIGGGRCGRLVPPGVCRSSRTNGRPSFSEEIAIETSRESVERITGVHEISRAWLPLEIYPISAGVKGGLAGGAAMAVLAAVYGILSGNGIWYPMNLLVAGLFPRDRRRRLPARSERSISSSSSSPFRCTCMISLLVGLLYGAMLPMAPRRPILLGGFVAPLLWSFLIHGSLAVINPVMNQRIDWLWFVLSQIGFGIVAGLVVVRQERIRTRQPVPLRVRMGIEAPGLMEEHRPRIAESRR